MRRERHERRAGSGGFTFLELVLAIALASLIIWAVAGGFQYAAALSALSQNKQAAVSDAEKIMEEVRRVADSAGLSGTGSASDANYWTAWVAGQSFSSLPSATRVVDFPEGMSTELLTVRVTVGWKEKDADRSVQLLTKVIPRAS